MARSAEVDPLEKFRFRLSVVAFDLSLTGLADTVSGLGLGGDVGKFFRVLQRAGFSQLDLPKANLSEMAYRENLDGQRFSKHAGLVRYEPVTLRRGVTENRDLYDWYRLVNDEIALLATAQELANTAKLTPVQTENFRKDVIIEVLDRKGEPVKSWYLLNAFPISYKGGDKLDASDEGKLVEEITLTYEVFLELEGGLEGFAKEIAKGVLVGGAGAIITALDIPGDITK